MKKLTLKNTLLATLLLSATHTTFANDEIFQVAIVKGAIGTSDLTEGKVESGIKKLTANKKNQDFYANKMNLCVAYLQSKSKHSDKTETVCTEAITSLESVEHKSNRVKYLTALNYSNRGVARYRKNQITAALKDFEFAVEMDKNPITSGNLQKFKRLLPIQQVESTSELSD
ncbi:hypothetical protein [Cognaticolwellia beringensis]|uniref:Tetratricopeptide repeat protein n=1 Tax=Cognaticolwellia beringensis TaxID=1967665 RepID=A0A222G966_9GAMM|nr:hypothetical protein [Cognaticolwellia beringensis]ASP48438.1 hypothetical protein B5D82_12065 [Cognaticolwellia beringensis]